MKNITKQITKKNLIKASKGIGFVTVTGVQFYYMNQYVKYLASKEYQKYDLEIERDQMEQKCSTLEKIIRQAQLVLLSFPMVLFYPFYKFFSLFHNDLRLYLRKVYHHLILYQIESSSPLFRKLAQWLSTRQDLLEKDICKLLEKVRDQNEYHSFKYTKAYLETQVSPEWRDFIEFDEENTDPIASGVIAQVQKAKLNVEKLTQDVTKNPDKQKDVLINNFLLPQLDSKIDVAVKVKHPRLDHHMKLDYEILKSIGYLFKFKFPKLYDNLNEFESSMLDQINLRNEMKQLQRFHMNFFNNRRVTIPDPVLASDGILIESFKAGINISSQIARLTDNKIFEVNKYNNHFVVTTGFDTLVQMMFKDKYLHVDLHPGNLMLQEGYWHKFKLYTEQLTQLNSDSYNQFTKVGLQLIDTISYFFDSQKVVLLDCGMAQEMSDKQKNLVLRFMKTITDQDHNGVTSVLLEFGKGNDFSTKEQNDISASICELLKTQAPSEAPGKVLEGIMSIVREHGITVDTDLGNLIINLLCIESMAKKLDPEQNIFDKIMPQLQIHAVVGEEQFKYQYKFAKIYKDFSDNVELFMK